MSSSLRGAALALGAAAAAVLVQSRTPAPYPIEDDAGVISITQVEALNNPDAGPQPWLLRTDGWHINFDQVAVDFPTVAETFAARPRTVPEVSLSPFDPLIRYYAGKKGFDWRLIAAIIAAESGFDPRAQSPFGAYGLMQVREVAARAVGETSFRSPADNIRTGVRYLRKLERYVPNAYGRDRVLLILAAYNVGPGHLSDAQQLARENGLDPNRWFGGVREVLPALENPRVYPSLRYGFARGSDVVSYVEGVWQRFVQFQRATAADAYAGPDPRSSFVPVPYAGGGAATAQG